jgi:hypothetical protein
MDGVDSLFLGLMAVLAAAAMVVFFRVQRYLSDPDRQARNEEWFAQFEANLRQRYRNKELLWRTHVLEMQFRDPRAARYGRSGGGGSGHASNALM